MSYTFVPVIKVYIIMVIKVYIYCIYFIIIYSLVLRGREVGIVKVGV